ncbi:hypothetical protein [Frigoribacterium sp. PhB118]|uniref:hypothetical protein n=1 Tax=Frigoribacterium sp. PhB118 TaxID=2485175 RepID=UPI000F481F8D|nr:hypothetical protein [Frigoribacterium sp. PhB118]ROS57196.1 hypothetical protein EDF21_0851 [Frigoribacterium sp. PhB118]
MAVGDAAGAKGLATYSDSLLVKDIDTALNQRGDEIAATMTRLEKVEAAVNQPILSVSRSTAQSTVQSGAWAMATVSLATTAELASGITWNADSGEAKVGKAGIYRVGGSVFYSTAPDTAGIQITRNSTDSDTSATIAGNVQAGRGVSTTRLVRLAEGDVLRLFVYQQSSNGARTIATAPYNLTLTAEWVRA